MERTRLRKYIIDIKCTAQVVVYAESLEEAQYEVEDNYSMVGTHGNLTDCETEVVSIEEDDYYEDEED